MVRTKTGPARICALAPPAAFFWVLAGSAGATPLASGGVTAAEVAAILQAKGYVAQIGKDEEGDPNIHSGSGAEGSGFDVYFFGCNKGPRCTSIEFSVAYHVEGGLTLAQINEWNHKKRFGRAYLDSENDPFIGMDVDVEKGFSTEAIDNNIDTWDSVVGTFRHFIGCTKKPDTATCKAD